MTKYSVVIHEDPEGGFWAEVPALPGCYSQCESVAELTDDVREAIAGVLEVMQEQGTENCPRMNTDKNGQEKALSPAARFAG